MKQPRVASLNLQMWSVANDSLSVVCLLGPLEGEHDWLWTALLPAASIKGVVVYTSNFAAACGWPMVTVPTNKVRIARPAGSDPVVVVHVRESAGELASTSEPALSTHLMVDEQQTEAALVESTALK